MNILIVSSYLPFPLYSGGHIRLYNLLKYLSKRHSITLVCEKRSNQAIADEQEVRKFCTKIITVSRKKQWSVSNILKTGFSFYPFLFIGHSSKEMKLAIKKELRYGKFDVIHVETSYVLQNVPKTSIPIVLVEHNIEYLVYKKYADSSSIFLRPFLYIDVLKLIFFEERFWKKVKRLVAVSEKEKELMQREDVAVVPNGVDIEKFKVPTYAKASAGRQNSKDGDKRILFIGDFKWIQNRDAAVWLLKEIWPVLNRKWKMENGKLTLLIVGKNIPDSIKKLSMENVVFDENAPDKTEEIYQKAFILVAPIRVGGGSRYKILEAMASGVPVVSTSLGIEGINANNKKEVIIADTAESFAQSIATVLENDELRNEITKNARKLIVENYDWRIIVKKLENVYESAITNI